MNTKQAISIISKHRPCPHDNADTNLGNGQFWAKCEDCGATFLQENWENYRKESAEFDEAVDVLMSCPDTEIPAQINQFLFSVNSKLFPVVKIIHEPAATHLRFITSLCDTSYAMMDQVHVTDSFIELVTDEGKRIFGIDPSFNNTCSTFWFWTPAVTSL